MNITSASRSSRRSSAARYSQNRSSLATRVLSDNSNFDELQPRSPNWWRRLPSSVYNISDRTVEPTDVLDSDEDAIAINLSNWWQFLPSDDSFVPRVQALTGDGDSNENVDVSMPSRQGLMRRQHKLPNRFVDDFSDSSDRQMASGVNPENASVSEASNIALDEIDNRLFTRKATRRHRFSEAFHTTAPPNDTNSSDQSLNNTRNSESVTKSSDGVTKKLFAHTSPNVRKSEPHSVENAIHNKLVEAGTGKKRKDFSEAAGTPTETSTVSPEMFKMKRKGRRTTGATSNADDSTETDIRISESYATNKLIKPNARKGRRKFSEAFSTLPRGVVEESDTAEPSDVTGPKKFTSNKEGQRPTGASSILEDPTETDIRISGNKLIKPNARKSRKRFTEAFSTLPSHVMEESDTAEPPDPNKLSTSNRRGQRPTGASSIVEDPTEPDIRISENKLIRPNTRKSRKRFTEAFSTLPSHVMEESDIAEPSDSATDPKKGQRPTRASSIVEDPTEPDIRISENKLIRPNTRKSRKRFTEAFSTLPSHVMEESDTAEPSGSTTDPKKGQQPMRASSIVEDPTETDLRISENKLIRPNTRKSKKKFSEALSTLQSHVMEESDTVGPPDSFAGTKNVLTLNKRGQRSSGASSITEDPTETDLRISENKLIKPNARKNRKKFSEAFSTLPNAVVEESDTAEPSDSVAGPKKLLTSNKEAQRPTGTSSNLEDPTETEIRISGNKLIKPKARKSRKKFSEAFSTLPSAVMEESDTAEPSNSATDPKKGQRSTGASSIMEDPTETDLRISENKLIRPNARKGRRKFSTLPSGVLEESDNAEPSDTATDPNKLSTSKKKGQRFMGASSIVQDPTEQNSEHDATNKLIKPNARKGRKKFAEAFTMSSAEESDGETPSVSVTGPTETVHDATNKLTKPNARNSRKKISEARTVPEEVESATSNAPDEADEIFPKIDRSPKGVVTRSLSPKKYLPEADEPSRKVQTSPKSAIKNKRQHSDEIFDRVVARSLSPKSSLLEVSETSKKVQTPPKSVSKRQHSAAFSESKNKRTGKNPMRSDESEHSEISSTVTKKQKLGPKKIAEGQSSDDNRSIKWGDASLLTSTKLNVDNTRTRNENLSYLNFSDLSSAGKARPSKIPVSVRKAAANRRSVTFKLRSSSEHEEKKSNVLETPTKISKSILKNTGKKTGGDSVRKSRTKLSATFDRQISAGHEVADSPNRRTRSNTGNLSPSPSSRTRLDSSSSPAKSDENKIVNSPNSRTRASGKLQSDDSNMSPRRTSNRLDSSRSRTLNLSPRRTTNKSLNKLDSSSGRTRINSEEIEVNLSPGRPTSKSLNRVTKSHSSADADDVFPSLDGLVETTSPTTSKQASEKTEALVDKPDLSGIAELENSLTTDSSSATPIILSTNAQGASIVTKVTDLKKSIQSKSVREIAGMDDIELVLSGTKSIINADVNKIDETVRKKKNINAISTKLLERASERPIKKVTDKTSDSSGFSNISISISEIDKFWEPLALKPVKSNFTGFVKRLSKISKQKMSGQSRAFKSKQSFGVDNLLEENNELFSSTLKTKGTKRKFIDAESPFDALISIQNKNHKRKSSKSIEASQSTIKSIEVSQSTNKSIGVSQSTNKSIQASQSTNKSSSLNTTKTTSPNKSSLGAKVASIQTGEPSSVIEQITLDTRTSTNIIETNPSYMNIMSRLNADSTIPKPPTSQFRYKFQPSKSEFKKPSKAALQKILDMPDSDEPPKFRKIVDFFPVLSKKEFLQLQPPKARAPPRVISPAKLIDGKVYKPKLFKPKNKRWVNPRFYKYLQNKMEKRYGLQTVVESENVMRSIVDTVDRIMKSKKYEHKTVRQFVEMLASHDIIDTMLDFFNFVADYLPYEFRLLVVPVTVPLNCIPKVPYDPKTLREPIIKDKSLIV